MSNFETLIRRHAESKFGKENERAIAEWVGYWRGNIRWSNPSC